MSTAGSPPSFRTFASRGTATPSSRRSNLQHAVNPLNTERFTQLIERIDQLNSQDPHTELIGGVPRPRELIYSQRLTAWVLRLNPHASEELRIAARGQHVCRWMIPRERYERNRRGYLRWRETLKTFHADKAAALMREVGFPEEAVARVSLLIRKKELSTDSDTQTLEDALCLVFLETQFAELRQKTPEEKMRDVIVKTWKKMSDQGRAEALRLDLPDEVKVWIGQINDLPRAGKPATIIVR